MRMRTAAVLLFAIAAGACMCVAVSAAEYTNPVVDADTPDPGVLFSGGAYYAVTTSKDADDAFPIRRSHDLVAWHQIGFVFPRDRKPKWAVTDFWAPEIHKLGGDKGFVVYFAARDTTGILCVGAATAQQVVGPWTPLDHPLVRNDSLGGVGSIDPTFYRHERDHTQWLIWKEDGNGHSPPLPTPIWAQRVSDDGLQLHGDKHQLITNTLEWEGPLVEAPWLIHTNGTFYLFYSANGYAGPAYAVGVAAAPNLLGPYTKHPTPIVHSPANEPRNPFFGPGHCSVVRVAGAKDERYVMVYHAWYGNNGIRTMMADAIEWAADAADGPTEEDDDDSGAATSGIMWPHLASDEPSYTPQPIP